MRRLLLLIAIGLVTVGAGLTGLYLSRPASVVRTPVPLNASAELPAPPIIPRAQSAPSPIADQPPSQAVATRQRQVFDVDRYRQLSLKIQDGMLDSNYGRLFRQFGLSQVEIDFFKRLLGDRDTQRRELHLATVGQELTREQRSAWMAARTSKLATINQKSNAAIRQFLNHEGDFQSFLEWEDTAPERLQATLLRPIFSSNKHPLSSEQSDQLADLTVAVRKASRPAPSASAPRISTGSQVSEQRAQQERQRAEADDQSILAQAASFLTPEQLVTLEQALEGWRMVKFPVRSTPGTAAQ